MFNVDQQQCNQSIIKRTGNPPCLYEKEYLSGNGVSNISRIEYSRNLVPLFPYPLTKSSQTPARKNTATLLVECLENEGVSYIFGLHEDDDSFIGEALRQSSIQFIPARHAQGAAQMAQVYSRLTGKPGVCFAASLQGAFNFLPGSVSANLRFIPLIIITEQATFSPCSFNSGFDSTDSQELPNPTTLFTTVIRDSHQICSPKVTSETVRNAFRQAQKKVNTNRPGAVHIDLPKIIAETLITTEKPLSHKIEQQFNSNSQAIDQAKLWISQVQSPVILVGSGVMRSNSREALIAFATQLQIPVLSAGTAKGIIPETHPLALGIIDSPKDVGFCGIDWADLVIAIGCSSVDCPPEFWNRDGDIPSLHIDSSHAAINRYYQPRVELVGDIATLLIELLKQTERRNGLMSSLLRTRPQVNRLQSDTQIPFNYRTLTNTLKEVLKPDDILLSDKGLHREWIVHHYTCEYPNTCLTFHNSDSTGLAISGAITAKLINPERSVVAVVSADGFMKNYPAIEPAGWMRTPFVTLICNFGDCHPSFTEIAKSMGFNGYQITLAQDLIPTIKTALLQDVPTIIDCPVDYRDISPYTFMPEYWTLDKKVMSK